MRVLVVEDDHLVRRLMADDLTEAGYCVTEANNADDAISTLDSGGAVQLIVTDVRMPGSLDGFALARCVKAKWPAMKILVVSGFANEDGNAIRSYDAFLGKPFTGTTLRKAITNLIGGPAAAL